MEVLKVKFSKEEMSHLIRRGFFHLHVHIQSRRISTTQKWSLPDRINPRASSLVSCDPFQPVVLRMEESGPGSMPPISVQVGVSIMVLPPVGEYSHQMVR